MRLCGLLFALGVAACAESGAPVPGCRADKDCAKEQRCAPKTGVCIGFNLPLGEPTTPTPDGGARDGAAPDAARRDGSASGDAARTDARPRDAGADAARPRG